MDLPISIKETSRISPPQSSKYYAVFPHHCTHLRSRTAFWSKSKFLMLPPHSWQPEKGSELTPMARSHSTGARRAEQGGDSSTSHRWASNHQAKARKQVSFGVKPGKPNHPATAPTPTQLQQLPKAWAGAEMGPLGPQLEGTGGWPQGGCSRQSRAAGATWA